MCTLYIVQSSGGVHGGALHLQSINTTVYTAPTSPMCTLYSLLVVFMVVLSTYNQSINTPVYTTPTSPMNTLQSSGGALRLQSINQSIQLYTQLPPALCIQSSGGALRLQSINQSIHLYTQLPLVPCIQSSGGALRQQSINQYTAPTSHMYIVL
jgi:hypothetical protein